jgi:hypothetical protein
MTTTSTIDRAGLTAVVRRAVHGAKVRHAAHFGLNPDMGLGPRSAKLGSRHDATSKFKLVERSFLLV